MPEDSRCKARSSEGVNGALYILIDDDEEKSRFNEKKKNGKQ
jgi:rRNA processing protein Gar1